MISLALTVGVYVAISIIALIFAMSTISMILYIQELLNKRK